MASSSQRVHFSLSHSLSQNSIQFFLWSRSSTPNEAALPIVHGYYIERCFRVRFLTTERWSWRTVQRVLHVCKDEASVFENCQKYRNAKSQYIQTRVRRISLKRTLCYIRLFMLYVRNSTYQTDINIYTFTWMYCKSVYIYTCSTIS